MKFWIMLAIGLLLSFSTLAKDEICDSKCKLTQVEAYFDKIDKVSKKGSTEKDIDSFLAQVHDDVKYEHPEYEADFTKEKWRAAFVRQLNKGSYTDGPENEARILNVIYGKSHAAVEYSYGKVGSDGIWQKGVPFFALFGFKEGKISLVREYW